MLRAAAIAAPARVLRARQWSHFLLLPLAGAELSTGLSEAWRLPIALLAAAGALGFAYAVNAVTDRAYDDAGKNPLAGMAHVGAEVGLVVAGAGAVALGAAALLGPRAVGLVAVSLLAGVVYSAGPHLKAIPVLGLVANAAIFAPLPALGAARELPPAFAALWVAFVTLLTQNQLVHELGDAADDERGATLTTARWLGPRRTRAAIILLGILGAAGAIALSPRVPVGMAAVVAFGVATAVALRRPPLRARVVHRFVALGAGGAMWALTLLR